MLKIVGICLLEASFTATEEYWKTRGGRNTRVHVFTIAHLYVCRCRRYKRKQEGCVKKFGGNQVKKISVAMQTSCREFVHAKRKGKGFSKLKTCLAGEKPADLGSVNFFCFKFTV